MNLVTSCFKKLIPYALRSRLNPFDRKYDGKLGRPNFNFDVPKGNLNTLIG